MSELSLCELTLNFLKDGWVGVPLWFVPVLFLALIIVRITFDISNKILRYAVWIFLPLISIDLCHYHSHLPWNMAVVPFATSLILIGHLCKGTLFDDAKTRLKGWLALLVTVGISMVARLDMCFNSVLPITLVLIGALAGSYMIFALSKWMEKHLRYTSIALREIGKETYLILAFAEIFIVYLNFFFDFNAIIKYAIMIVALTLLSVVRRWSRL